MKIGAIYVNGWASQENPHRAGLCVGEGELLFPDGSRGLFERNKALVQWCEPWAFSDIASGCAAADELHGLASRYASEILWPAEYDDGVKRRVFSGEYTPPTYEEWIFDQSVAPGEPTP